MPWGSHTGRDPAAAQALHAVFVPGDSAFAVEKCILSSNCCPQGGTHFSTCSLLLPCLPPLDGTPGGAGVAPHLAPRSYTRPPRMLRHYLILIQT